MHLTFWLFKGLPKGLVSVSPNLEHRKELGYSLDARLGTSENKCKYYHLLEHQKTTTQQVATRGKEEITGSLKEMRTLL